MDSFLTKLITSPVTLYKLFRQLIGEKISFVAEDTRSYKEQEQDYRYGDDIILPRGNTSKRITKLPFEAYRQYYTSACGAFAAGHARRLFEGTVTYPVQWYRTRINFANEGMFIQDVLKLMARASEVKPPKEIPKLTEEYANAMPWMDVFNNDRADKYEYTKIEPYDANAVFDASSNNYPVLIAFYSTKEEWAEEMTPWDVVTLYTSPVRHYVIVLPNSYHIKDGTEWVSVIDSTPNKGFSLRHISKEFLMKRMYLGGGFYYPVSKKKKKVTALPTKLCTFGERNLNVLALQVFLLEEGYMVEKHRTGYYGPITSKAVLEWQITNIKDYEIPKLIELEGKWWGPLSVKAAKLKYPNLNE